MEKKIYVNEEHIFKNIYYIILMFGDITQQNIDYIIEKWSQIYTGKLNCNIDNKLVNYYNQKWSVRLSHKEQLIISFLYHIRNEFSRPNVEEINKSILYKYIYTLRFINQSSEITLYTQNTLNAHELIKQEYKRTIKNNQLIKQHINRNNKIRNILNVS